jgi:hypothetical protein
VQGVEPGASYMLGTHATHTLHTELHPSITHEI